MDDTLKLVVAQTVALPLNDSRARLEQVLKLMDECTQHAPDLIVFPEAQLSGYAWPTKNKALEAALDSNHLFFDLIQTKAQEMDCDVIVGSLVNDAGALRNVAIHLQHTGTRFIYTKSTPLHLGADRFCRTGSQLFGQTQVKDFKIAILICYDLTFPLAAFCAGLSGVDLIVVPTNWPQESAATTANFTVLSRAYETKCYIAAANKIGSEGDAEFCGSSCIVNPAGEWMQRAEALNENTSAARPSYLHGQLLVATLNRTATKKYRRFNPQYGISLGDVPIDLVTAWLSQSKIAIPTSHDICQDDGNN